MIVRQIGPGVFLEHVPLTPLQARTLADSLHAAAHAAEDFQRETTAGKGGASRITPSCCHLVRCPDTGYGPICVLLAESYDRG